MILAVLMRNVGECTGCWHNCIMSSADAHIAEARKLEHHWPHALTVKYRESQHESS